MMEACTCTPSPGPLLPRIPSYCYPEAWRDTQTRNRVVEPLGQSSLWFILIACALASTERPSISLLGALALCVFVSCELHGQPALLIPAILSIVTPYPNSKHQQSKTKQNEQCILQEVRMQICSAFLGSRGLHAYKYMHVTTGPHVKTNLLLVSRSSSRDSWTPMMMFGQYVPAALLRL